MPTYDLDVLVFLPSAGGSLVSLDGVYRSASERSYPAQKEHILIEGVPSQLVPSPTSLADEAIRSAASLDYQGVGTRVVLPEYLIALYLEPLARTPKHRERAAMLLEWQGLNREHLNAILEAHGLTF